MSDPQDYLQFVRRGVVVELRNVDPNETLLDYLRIREGQCGTKEGCAEGDCGACTVAVGMLRGNDIHYEPVNSCIQLLGMMHGKVVVTVEDLANDDSLHPVQQALVEHHGSQCGFCTPGIVMSLFTLYHSGSKASRGSVNNWLAGNLCRCTGYRPIADAAMASCTGVARDRFDAQREALTASVKMIDPHRDLHIGNQRRFFAAPASLAALTRLAADHRDATFVAGATDVGLWITKQLRDLPKIVHLGRVQELARVERVAGQLQIGAAASYNRAEHALAALDADVGELVRRIGSKQVRAVGTVGGNIANGSPIGDMPPLLIALGASIELRLDDVTRTLPLEAFFVDYAKQDRAHGEILTRILVPELRPSEHLRCYKISKRFDQDISGVLGAFRFTLSGGRIAHARIAYGGMAATPRRAMITETAVTGIEVDRVTDAKWAELGRALERDFQPIDDMRASAQYRTQTAGALLKKALIELDQVPTRSTRIVGVREQVV